MHTLALLLLSACSPDPVTVVGESVGSCSYVSSFSQLPECRDFFSATDEQADASCADDGAVYEPGVACEVTEILGTCTYEADGFQIRTTVEGTDGSVCGSNRFGCETFAKGYWEPGPNCSDEEELVVLEDPWPQPERICMDPLEGEPPGQSEDGQVCTWQIVSGATEEGRSFSDYADCDVIRRQRPYSPVPANPLADDPDPRMDDPAYVAELDWVRGQMKAAACDCCHSANAPDGPSVFNTDFEGNMANQFYDRGLAMAAGWIPTIGFGTWPPEENNGFERSSPENPHLSAIPTTDQARMMAFFAGELEHRGRTPQDFEGDTYGAGPLDEQLNYVPERCSEDEGIASDGLLRWLPGRARYVYVLEADSKAPTVPPNLDTPDGTLWRIDLDPTADPVRSETITYGEVPPNMVQVWPEAGEPPALVDGQDYYLYVTADVMFPISRCVFTAGEPPPASCDTTGGGAGVGALLLAAAGLVRRRR
jgi:MYXO-CTERM domain-containing protein